MPVMNGYDATVKIRELEGDKLGIADYCHDRQQPEAEEEHCRDVGMSDFLRPPSASMASKVGSGPVAFKGRQSAADRYSLLRIWKAERPGAPAEKLLSTAVSAMM